MNHVNWLKSNWIKGENMVVMITGATGYVASYLINQLPKQDTIYAIARTKHAGNFLSTDHIHYLYCDMDHYDRLWKQIPENIDCVIHCAWDGARGSNNDNESIQQNNAAGTIKLWESAHRLGCKQWIQIGSLAEYGAGTIPETALSEQSAARPHSAYAKAKLQCAMQILEKCQCHGMEFCEVRLGSVYGPQMQKNALIQYVLDNLTYEKEIRLKSNCQQMWEFIFIGDVVYILDQIIHKGIEARVLNVSSGETDLLKNFIFRMKNIVSSNSNIIFGEEKNGAFGCKSIWCNIDLLRNYLGDYGFTSFEAGINQILF